jgi:hypothetical protein
MSNLKAESRLGIYTRDSFSNKSTDVQMYYNIKNPKRITQMIKKFISMK